MNRIFLAGTIDSGQSTNWQKQIVDAYKDSNIEFYNPRRNNFPVHPSTTIVTNQIRWEQEHLDAADFIIMVFKDDSLSPITLLELGLYAQSGKLYVFCSPKYWRYLNVSETCRKYNIPHYHTTQMSAITEVIDSLIEQK